MNLNTEEEKKTKIKKNGNNKIAIISWYLIWSTEH